MKELSFENQQTPEQLARSEDEKKAKQFFKEKLEGEKLIEVPQDKNCELAIVVPIYNESVRRIIEQLKTIAEQQGITKSQFEVVYVVNNGEDDGSGKFQETLEANKKILQLPVWKNIDSNHSLSDYSDDEQELFAKLKEQLNLFAIDKSTKGNEIKDCNVGKARNRGVAEASKRFYDNQKNGILMQTDADVIFEDKEFFAKVFQAFHDDSSLIGIAGGLDYIFDPDSHDEKRVAELRQKAEMVFMKRRYENLVRFLSDGELRTMADDDYFSGPNMISKSFETAVIGGLLDVNKGEDPQFGYDLKAYANKRKKRVVNMRDKLKVVTAMRESYRTGSSYGNVFDGINLDEDLIVNNPFAEKYEIFKKSFYDGLTSRGKDSDFLQDLLSDNLGRLLIPHEMFDELVAYMNNCETINIAEPFYRNLVAKIFGDDFDIAKYIYNKKYKKVPLTQELYYKVAEEVCRRENGKILLKYLNEVTRLRYDVNGSVKQ